jgi:hypothetical protein
MKRNATKYDMTLCSKSLENVSELKDGVSGLTNAKKDHREERKEINLGPACRVSVSKNVITLSVFQNIKIQVIHNKSQSLVPKPG